MRLKGERPFRDTKQRRLYAASRTLRVGAGTAGPYSSGVRWVAAALRQSTHHRATYSAYARAATSLVKIRGAGGGCDSMRVTSWSNSHTNTFTRQPPSC